MFRFFCFFVCFSLVFFLLQFQTFEPVVCCGRVQKGGAGHIQMIDSSSFTPATENIVFWLAGLSWAINWRRIEDSTSNSRHHFQIWIPHCNRVNCSPPVVKYRSACYRASSWLTNIIKKGSLCTAKKNNTFVCDVLLFNKARITSFCPDLFEEPNPEYHIHLNTSIISVYINMVHHRLIRNRMSLLFG